MNSPNRNLKQDFLVAAMVMKLELLPRDQCVMQIERWRNSTDASFAEWIKSHELLHHERLEMIRQIAESLVAMNRDWPELVEILRVDEETEREIAGLIDETGQELASATILEDEATKSIRMSSTNQPFQPIVIENESALGDATVSIKSMGTHAEATPNSGPLGATQRYEILHTHAEGGLGRVSIAQDRELGREVAFKQIKGDYVEDLASRRRFVFEAEVTGNLEHPGIVPVYSLSTDDQGHPFYAMRFIQGESFREAIGRFHRKGTQSKGAQSKGAQSKGAQSQDGSPSVDSKRLAESSQEESQSNKSRVLPFRQLLSRFVDLCQAMDYAHSRGVIHRDLKPSNVMLGEFGETLVVDWGLARNIGSPDEDQTVSAVPTLAEEDVTRPGTVVGTIAYMSPEQARGEIESLGPTSDIFSLGSILFLILTGEKPFGRFQGSEMLEAVRQCAFPMPNNVRLNVPRALETVCLKAMQKEPEQRYQSARELADDIERWLADEPVSAWREPISVRAKRWMKNHRTFVTTSAVTLVAATISLAIVLGVQADANHQLRIANSAEREAKEEAESDFRLALNAISQYHNEVSANFLLRQPEFAELQDELLDAPLTFYTSLSNRLADQDDPSRTQLEALFDSYTDLGTLASRIGKKDQVISSYEKALDVNSTLIEKFPEDYQYELARVKLLLQVAGSQVEVGDLDEAKRAYDEANSLLRDAASRAPTNDELADVLAQSYVFNASYCDASGDAEGVVESYEKAIEIRRRLAENDPENLDYLNNLALSVSELGLHYRDSGEPEKSESLMVEGVELQEELIRADPDDMFAVFRLAGSLSNLAYLWQDLEQYDDAIVAYENAEPAFRILVAEAPNVVRFQSGLASTLNNRGLMHHSLEQPELAEEAYLEALAIKERLAANFPRELSLRISLGGGYSNFAGFILGTGDEEEAIEWYTRAIETLREVLDENPDVVQARFFFRQAHHNRGLTHHRLGNFLQSAEDYGVAIEYNIPSEPVAPLMRRRAHTLIKGGAYDEVMPIAITLVELAEGDSDYYDIAVIHSLSIDAINKDTDIDDESKQALIDEHVERAVSALRAMWATGLVPRDVFINLLAKNEFLAGLRSSEEFQELVSEFDERD